MRRLISASAPVALVAVALAGCSAGDDSSVVDALRARHDSASRVQPFTSLVDLLPNRVYRMGEGPQWSYSTSVVKGRVTGVEPGRAFSAEDSPGGEAVPFDSPRAAWRTFHASVSVDEVIAGDALTADQRVGFALDPDVTVEAAAEQLKSMGTVVLFLRDSPVFAYDPHVLGTVWDGELVAQVGADGDLSLPVLAGDDEGKQAVSTASVSELESAARGPGEHIQLDASGSTVISREPAPK